MRRTVWVLVMAILMFAVSLWGQACSGDDDDDDAAGDGANDNSEGRVTASEVTVGFECIDYSTEDDGTDDVPFTDSVHVNGVGSCVYGRSAAELSVSLRENDGNGDGYIGLGLINFNGPGTFATGTELDGNIVEMAGPAGEYDSAGDTETDDSPAFDCTVDVDTNLHTVEIPDGGATTGWVEFTVTCPKLGSSGIGPVECNLDPQTWSFVIADCEAGL